MVLERVLRRLRRTPPLPRVDEGERLDTYPPPFPKGWYALCDDDELAPGAARFIEAFGEKLVLFRGEDGTLGVLDAYCPHLGANLAGGRVREGCLECPFHRWTFAADGRVTSIPYAGRLSPRLRTRSWPVRAHHGMIVMWFARRAPGDTDPLVPAWELDSLAAIDEGRLVYRGRHDAGVVRMHLCEFAENSADHRHFAPLHGDMFVPWTRIKLPGAKVLHEASWEADPERSHMAYFHDEAVLQLFGRVIPRSGAKATITFFGPGGIVTFRIESPDLGTLVMFQTHLPVGPLAQRVRFRWYANPEMPRPVVSYVVGNWVAQWREDIAIWENKIFRPKPMLVAGDGPVHQMRRWFSQFYAA